MSGRRSVRAPAARTTARYPCAAPRASSSDWACCSAPSLAQTPTIPDPPFGPLSWQTRIAPPEEPGDPLVVSGQVSIPPGSSRSGRARLRVPTDMKGLTRRAAPSVRRDFRDGPARTQRAATFSAPFVRRRTLAMARRRTCTSISPAPALRGQRRRSCNSRTIPRVGAEASARARREGRFGGVRPITRGADRAWRCTFDMKLHR